VRSFYRYACAHGYFDANPASAVRLPKARNTLAERILTEEEVEALLAAASPGRDQVLLTLLYHGGLRVHEALGLRWCDCVPRGERGQVTVFGKGSKSRAVLLPVRTWALLLELRDGAADSAYVFPAGPGGQGHLSAQRAWQIVRAAAEQAEIDKPVSPHWLRHAHATLALEKGADLKLVSATLGHSSLATTGAYLHVRPDRSSALVFE
jgi:integrase/recombinase XerD